ncbi:guanylate kinase [bacterium]|nr:guanylate kinase [bacterium]
MTKEQKSGILIVFSSASGAGKTTIAKEIVRKDPNLTLSVSYTTRLPRQAEQQGKDYFFISEDDFEKMVKEGKFLEWEKVHDAFYGTSYKFVQEKLSCGKDVILTIDVKGAKRIKKKHPDSISFFFRVSSVEELKKRLIKRGTETEESIAKRMEISDWEQKQAKDYNYHILNDKIENAVNEVLSIIETEKEKKEIL